MKISKSPSLLLILLSQLIFSHNLVSASLHNKWHNHSGPARGHEDITRLGVEIANNNLSALSSELMLFPPVPYGDAAVSSEHPMIQGNFATDFADRRMRDRYLPGSSDQDGFGSHPALQHLHFLRNYVQDELWSMKKTCEEAKKLMINSTLHAFEHFSQMDEFLYWIGHTTHTIQDAFSPAHVTRERDNPRKIKEICTWGKRFEGICYHQFFDLNDRIWNTSFQCLTGEENRDLSCLKEEAKWAVHATTGYLMAVSQLAYLYKKMKLENHGRIIKKIWEKMVTLRLKHFFYSPSSLYSGHFKCPSS